MVADPAATEVPASTAEVTFEAPRRFALITDRTRERQRLYTTGDVIRDAATGVAVKISRVENGRVQLTDWRTHAAVWALPGRPLPGFPTHSLAATPLVLGIEYRFVPTAGSLDPEPHLVGIEDRRAALRVDIPLAQVAASVAPDRRPGAARPGQPAASTDETLLGRVRVKPTGTDAYEVSARDLEAALDDTGRFLSENWPRVLPDLSGTLGGGIRIQSPIADGTLGPRGFRVLVPNLAERAGIELGDVILGVNGQPVNGLADLYRLYTRFQSDSSLSVIQLDLERQGRAMTKTYHLR